MPPRPRYTAEQIGYQYGLLKSAQPAFYRYNPDSRTGEDDLQFTTTARNEMPKGYPEVAINAAREYRAANPHLKLTTDISDAALDRPVGVYQTPSSYSASRPDVAGYYNRGGLHPNHADTRVTMRPDRLADMNQDPPRVDQKALSKDPVVRGAFNDWDYASNRANRAIQMLRDEPDHTPQRARRDEVDILRAASGEANERHSVIRRAEYARRQAALGPPRTSAEAKSTLRHELSHHTQLDEELQNTSLVPSVQSATQQRPHPIGYARPARRHQSPNSVEAIEQDASLTALKQQHFETTGELIDTPGKAKALLRQLRESPPNNPALNYYLDDLLQRTPRVPGQQHPIEWAAERMPGLAQRRQPASVVSVPPGVTITKESKDGALPKLIKAKAHSDKKQYGAKHDILRQLIQQEPASFYLDGDDTPGIVGIRHRPTGFKMHLPVEVVSDLPLGDKEKPLVKTETYTVPAAIVKAAGVRLPITVEVADSPGAQARGLMFQTDIPTNYGMFFKTASSFWMKNCPSEIAIAFLNKQGQVTDLQYMQPFSETSHRPRSNDACYAIEFNADWCRHAGIAKGDRIA